MFYQYRALQCFAFMATVTFCKIALFKQRQALKIDGVILHNYGKLDVYGILKGFGISISIIGLQPIRCLWHI